LFGLRIDFLILLALSTPCVTPCTGRVFCRAAYW